MVEKLKSVFQNQFFLLRLSEISQARKSQISLFLKITAFGAALFLAALGDFRIFPILFFAAAAFLIYARPLSGSDNYCYTWCAFGLLLAVSVLGMKILSGTVFFWPGIFLFSGIFYLLLGIKNYSFVKRSRIYHAAALLMFYALFIIFFHSDKSQLFLLKYIGVILAIFLIFKEWLALISSFHFPGRERLAALAAALLVAQLVWVVALLPIGFINSASFLTIFVFITGDLFLQHFTGGISRKFLWQRASFFAVLSAIIAWASSWKI